MKRPWLFILNFFILMLTLFILAGIQTTFWNQLFGTFPPPLLWMILVIFVSIYRRPVSGLFSVYFFGFFVGTFSCIPLKMMLIPLLLIFLVVYSIKGRIFWTGPGYFSILVGIGTFFYQFIFITSSLWLEKSPTSMMLGTRLTELILTPLFAYLIYFPLNFLDTLTIDQVTRESGGFQL